MQNINRIKEKILEARKIVIACHIHPDGDCLGSLLALGLGLAGMGKDVCMVSQDGVPERYRYLPGADKIKKVLRENCDMAIAVDCNAKEMLGRTFNIVNKAAYILEIDHHEFRNPFGNISFVDEKAAAVGELVYELLKHLKAGITRDIAQNILTSIVVETNSFKLPAVRPLTFNICADLIGTGVDFHNLSEMVYWSKRKEAAILAGICMSKVKFLEKEKVAWAIIRKKEVMKINGRDEDTDAVADEILSIKTVRVAVLFREKNKRALRVSLRSKGDINVGALAVRYGGGGHFDCAGCSIANDKNIMKEILRLSGELVK